MLDDALIVLTVIAALGSGLIGGFFFAFSNTIMRALGNVSPPQGILAMQTINVVVLNPVFLVIFLGTALISLVLAVSAVPQWGEPGAIYRLIGGLLYVVGSFLVTMAFNVPRNNALAAVDAGSAEGAARWAEYLPGWTAWNTVRTLAALAAALFLTLTLLAG